jgi:hypothetical protein
MRFQPAPSRQLRLRDPVTIRLFAAHINQSGGRVVVVGQTVLGEPAFDGTPRRTGSVWQAIVNGMPLSNLIGYGGASSTAPGFAFH